MKVHARWGLAAVGLGAYALLAHHLVSRDAGSVPALLTLLGPMVGAALWGLWHAGNRLVALGLAGLAVAVLLNGSRLPVSWLYLAQHAGIHLGLAWWFGRTLFDQREPFITQLARRLHDPMQPTMVVYTRHVTVAWTAYFVAIAGSSILLFAFASLAAWSLFANVLTPVSLVAMFAVEYLLRYRLHPEFERVAFLDAVRAYRASAAADTPR
ncbi:MULTISPECIES: hypothetical protein [unclassified Rhizobacter]|uniref:COG4648 family protein n=1 Tax=unclassified Rhizobacter TaxID=2640088 RepID=UPI000701C222|nr:MULTISPECIES: hypothetical protein [unclassified Rhizobacter]KQU77042.1 hypothetical protein ASC88_23265 [Rhizobacter sp. Root29]KQW14206.1 hypothetical protein ASC98_16305 [Rhizobacter sp. Root1238]KRB18573.1 hypothetical protein ASE08_04845 [Rhizobacter sp. Root16D2]